MKVPGVVYACVKVVYACVKVVYACVMKVVYACGFGRALTQQLKFSVSPKETQKRVATHGSCTGVPVNAGGGSAVIAGKRAGTNVLLKRCNLFIPC